MDPQQHLVFLLLGLASGAVFASLAMGLVVTYRSSGVLNFAIGSMALLSGYTYAFLRKGELFVPIPGLPATVSVGGSDIGFVPALLVTLTLAAVTGLLLYLVVFRPLRTAPAVARGVASIGVMIVLTGCVVNQVSTTPVVKAIFPDDVWTVFGVRISQDRVWFALTVVLVAVGLAALFHYTPFGLATRAAAGSERGAFVSGLSPDRLAALNWMLGASVVGLAGVLISPVASLNPVTYTLLIVPALAAAILGRFKALLPAVVGGLAIGMLRGDVDYLQSQYDVLPDSGLSELVPLILILLVLVVRAQPLPTRGAIIRQTLGRAPRPQRLHSTTATAAAVGVVAILALSGPWRTALLTSLIFAIIALSLVVVTGYAGQVSLAQLTLAGVAGFLLGPLTTDWELPIIHSSIPFPLAPLLAALAATAIGVVVGLPALRVRGLPVAVVTLSLAVTVEALWFRNSEYVTSRGNAVTGPTLFGLDLRNRVGTSSARVGFCLLVLVVLVAVAYGVARLRTSRLGSAMLAVRANEKSAAASGINVVRTKIYAFAIGAFIAGLGGSMLGYQLGNVTIDSFFVLLGLGLFATVYLAGMTSVSGGILAGILCANGLVFHATTEWIHLGNWYTTIAGAALVFTVIRNPEGILGPIHAHLAKRRATTSAPGPAPAEKREPRRSDVKRTPPELGRPDLLSFRDIAVHYGGVTAVDGVSIDVAEGSIVGLIGPNGAGKTTLLDAVSGFARSSGSVLLEGESMDDLAPYQRIRAGLGRTFQAIELYDDLSVTENVVVGLAATTGRAAKPGPDTLEEVFALLGLSDVADRPAGELSQGRRQLVSVARALVGRPRVLLLDEPAGGLDTSESHWLGERLRDIRAAGITIVLIDHDVSLVLNLCDQIHVLDFGKVIASGPPSVIQSDQAVAAAYLGTTHAVPVEVA